MSTGVQERSCWHLSGTVSYKIMIANYHTHTWRCNHASGTEEEYVRAAIDRGLEVLGFSDHTPYPFPWYHYSWFRMKTEDLGAYVATVMSLRQRYRDQIRIHIGVEAEYYPAYFPDLVDILKDHRVEYMILGQHYIDNELGAHYSGNPSGKLEHLKRYCYQTMEAMQTGQYTYFAHPDLINYTGDESNYREYVRQLCREAKSCSIPLEINLLGLEKGKHYPNWRFWEIAAEEGCQAILGCDTHEVKAMKSTASEEKALTMVRELGIDLLDTVMLRSVG